MILENPTFVLFAILSLGIVLGNIQFKGISLGSSGVLFVALLAGHFGFAVPDGITGIGTALFVYCVGLSVGNRFFASLVNQGSTLVLLSIIVISIAWLVTVSLSSLLGINDEMAAGIFAGALTSTPALAAATEALEDPSLLNIGYGVAYPFGVIGVVLFVQLLPRLLKQDLGKLDPTTHNSKGDPHKIIARVVHVTNQELYGKNIKQMEADKHLLCCITRKVTDGLLQTLDEGECFEEGKDVLLVGERANVHREAMALGHIDPNQQHPRSFGDESKDLIVLNPKLCQIPLNELKLLTGHGIIISRITRLGVTFVPSGTTVLVRNDMVHVVGSPKAISKFSAHCGHRSTAINATDIFSLTAGITLGIIVGNINFTMGEGPGFSLGMAGGPLLVALILGHFGKLGPVVGYMPRPARVLIMELALMLFLAGAGVSGGGKLVETLQAQGVAMFLTGAAVTIIPMLVAFVLARKVFKLSMPESLGGICGSMTSTPALGAITAKTDSQSPVIAYATAYPAALILMTIFAKAVLMVM
ncbi:MAG: TrkA C-terminal domain-containing protein [Akkermansia sp.]